MMTQDPFARQRRDLVEAEIDGELLAMDVELGICFGFNSTATRVWSLIEEPKRLSQICAALSHEFDVSPEACRHDVLELLQSLQERGLVTLD